MKSSRHDFTPVRDALARCAGEGVTIRYWWRDDDATHSTPALERLLTLSRETDVPVALAVIPARAEQSLKDRLEATSGTDVLVHGLAHRNHAAEGMKKAEFGVSRQAEALVTDARAGLQLLSAIMPGVTLPVFVPPWNRVSDTLVPMLAAIGYRGLSTFGPVAHSRATMGLQLVNTHIDPIAWKKGGGLAAPSALIQQITQVILDKLTTATEAEPIGLLTHHLVHDEDIWHFVSVLLETFRASPATQPVRAADLFGRS